MTIPDVTPDISGFNIAWFKDDQGLILSFPPGDYGIEYVNGAYQRDPEAHPGFHACFEYYIIGVISAQSPVSLWLPYEADPDGVYTTQEEAEAANIGRVVNFTVTDTSSFAPVHSSRFDMVMLASPNGTALRIHPKPSTPIGVMFQDIAYQDNISGSPNPTFRLHVPG